MSDNLNLLIGNGETLIGEIPLKGKPGSKTYPYSIEEARLRLAPLMQTLGTDLDAVPLAARPAGVGVATFTVHPAFLAKSYLPDVALRKAGLRTVGSRLKMIKPERDKRPNVGDGPQPSADLYVAGTDMDFARLSEMLADPRLPRSNQDELRRIETLGLLASEGRLGYISPDGDELRLEVALHVDEFEKRVLDGFSAWVRQCNGEALVDKRIICRGLVFVPVRVPRSALGRLAQYSMVRVVRSMPRLRAHTGKRGAARGVSLPQLPVVSPVSSDLKVAIFDGGCWTTVFRLGSPSMFWQGLKSPMTSTRRMERR